MQRFDRIKVILDILKGVGATPDYLEDPYASQVKRILKNNTLPQDLENDKNVIGIGLGITKRSGHSDEKCVTLFLDESYSQKKQAEVTLRIDSLIDRASLGYIPVRFEVVGKIDLIAHRLRNQMRPAVGGCSIGHSNSTSGGTIGCLVTKRGGENEKYILSNSHAIAKCGTARKGDPVIQPCLKYGGQPGRDTIAFLDKFVPFKPYPEENMLDVALAGPISDSECNSEIFQIGSPPADITSIYYHKMPVKKIGSTTGLTDGTIIATQVLLQAVHYPEIGMDLRFNGLISAKLKCDLGDSGALILNEQDEAIGLLTFKDGYGNSYFSPITEICNKLQVDVVTK